ncbi:unnamed protein product [Cylicocyclus nassatus]|uniref:Uncharacterized protein n=1 Tax=Cylicocyclus nassatus TaxID=53992 RepID=A0AA36M5Q2_CYLNA|nr:unnamed protein product [Cylicocyclus nassatus]
MSDAMERIQQKFAKKKEDEAYRHHQNYIKWKLEYAEAEQRAREFKAYWERRAQDDRDLWRDKLSPQPFPFLFYFPAEG